ncbi:MAG TPA: alpha-L-arabinofuranosidase C-terminal domain-containing protein [Paludibacteraceae bacterium]|nr:alpha-L-arabinofuranosidase C-terminal domain-containing protein [Paludibacteraceae bacterium]HPS10764.1 alpha-L-arabinofuranosidase C-terminal domain-containing protein [Paludibacteraceae bacterium]
MTKTKFSGLLILLLVAAQLTMAQTHNILVDFKKNGVEIQKTMYGIFFEDINYGADGGLYAELVKNRSFDFPQPFLGWSTFGKVEIKNDGPFENNPNYVRLSYSGHSDKHTGLENEGFFGIAVKQNNEYRFSVWSRKVSNENAGIRIELIDEESNIITSQKLDVNSSDWKQYELILKPNRNYAKSRLRIFLTSKGGIDLEHVSLFPVDTWKGRKNGLRKDLAQALYDLKPGVFRFPGGCIVEGTDLNTRYQWKNSIGPVENRKLNENRWQYTFTNRFFPDYYQSYGLGFFEFFQLSEDIGAEPLPVLSCGLACQFQNKDEHAHAGVGAELDPYIQDALDLIEFANGSTETKYGKIRAEMGHPEPFNMKLIAIGNEQWGSLYPERLEPFMKAIKARYPEIKIIGSSGPSPDGKDFEYGWQEMRRLKADLVDEHYYRDPAWFLSGAARYDKYDRKGPKVFAGEYACHPQNRKNNFESALCEAAFMTGFERNADVVHMCTYAPLFAHVQGWQWRPDLIWFDNMNSVRSVNYYVQQLYGHNAGTNVLNTSENKLPLTGQDGIYASSVYDKNKNEIILKIANTSDAIKTINYNLKGLKNSERAAKKTILKSSGPDMENTLENPTAVAPVTEDMKISGNNFQLNLEPKSFYLLNIQL